MLRCVGETLCLICEFFVCLLYLAYLELSTWTKCVYSNQVGWCWGLCIQCDNMLLCSSWMLHDRLGLHDSKICFDVMWILVLIPCFRDIMLLKGFEKYIMNTLVFKVASFFGILHDMHALCCTCLCIGSYHAIWKTC